MKEIQDKKKVDLLIICGDFQAVRNFTDLNSMCCPSKYRQLGEFYRYYSGELVAPIPTIFIGGNHEAGIYNRELYLGGWAAKNIYFMGLSNVIWFKGLRIGGISGIDNDSNVNKGYYEKFPFHPIERFKSLHHTRIFEIMKLALLKQKIDIFSSHDWPSEVAVLGDTDSLIKTKPWFKSDIKSGKLGSKHLDFVLKKLKPDFWFSAHLHVKFKVEILWEKYYNSLKSLDHIAPINSTATENTFSKNEDEILLEISDDEANIPSSADFNSVPVNKNSEEIIMTDSDSDNESINLYKRLKLESASVLTNLNLHNKCDTDPNSTIIQSHSNNESLSSISYVNTTTEDSITKKNVKTTFLSLDKCMPRRQYLEYFDFEVPSLQIGNGSGFKYDPEWIAILKTIQPLIPKNKFIDENTMNFFKSLSSECDTNSSISSEIDRNKKALLNSIDDWNIPDNFVQTAPSAPRGTDTRSRFPQANNHETSMLFTNPQITKFCEKFGIVDIFRN
ncbi:Lariat debranching enzyme [Smittium culicis]|uniref:Lariat debranching enzyme n=1 Tax=Smittium culicis TaxID=133412 RepID=A0A1R1Y3V5_9FUNG|nr:Lariat debranching enzyme [Smittium culicis]